jgi:hypothetical protein
VRQLVEGRGHPKQGFSKVVWHPLKGAVIPAEKRASAMGKRFLRRENGKALAYKAKRPDRVSSPASSYGRSTLK